MIYGAKSRPTCGGDGNVLFPLFFFKEASVDIIGFDKKISTTKTVCVHL